MILEIDVAINYLLSYCYSQLDREKVDSFKKELSEILTRNYTGHWHASSPQRGSGYRALLFSPDLTDPAIVGAAEASEIPIKVIRSQLPAYLTIWVDPCEVSYRVGERGDVTSLWQEKQQQHLQLRPKEHKANRKQHKNKNSKSLVRWKQPVALDNRSCNSNSSSSSSSLSTSTPSSSVPPSPAHATVTSPTAPLSVRPSPNGNAAPRPISPLARQKQIESPPPLASAPISSLFSTNSRQTWCSLASIDSKAFSSSGTSRDSSSSSSSVCDEDAQWSVSTWDSCGSSVNSDDSGLGFSPISSPACTPLEETKAFNSDSGNSAWKSLFSQFSDPSRNSYSATDKGLSTKANRLMYTSQLVSHP